MIAEGRKILIVDDDETLLEELDTLLSDNGYRTMPFTDSALAAVRAREELPDLILLDLKLEGKSGFVVATELTRIPTTAHIPILGMTGFYDGRMYAILMNICGFRGCLMKPIEPAKLLSTIERLLEEDEGTGPNGNGNDEVES
jgi:DNA-binding response OmpR family regulator